MSLRKKEYLDRLVDKKIEDYLSIFGTISIEGPKWCGKAWASENQANSSVLLTNEDDRQKAELSLEYIFENELPILIDEWNLVPKIWDTVRNKCDEVTRKGNYILTCSTKLTDEEQKNAIKHSGAGRIGRISMNTMSLYESKNSTGKVSIMDMYSNKVKDSKNKEVSLIELATLIIRGGWPANLTVPNDKISIIPKNYIESILDKDIHEDKKRNKEKMMMLLQSLARNESTIASKKTLLKDIKDNESGDIIKSRITVDDYLDVLSRLHLIENQKAYSSNYRSPDRIGTSSKIHFTDVSLACSLLNLTPEKLLKDLNTFGFMFEALVERDLRIYMDYLDGNIFHFRDNVSGLEVDTILEFNDGEYAAVEIKLGFNGVEEAKKTLLKFYNDMIKKPKFMCIIVGYFDMIVKDPETGIYIIPITALKP